MTLLSSGARTQQSPRVSAGQHYVAECTLVTWFCIITSSGQDQTGTRTFMAYWLQKAIQKCQAIYNSANILVLRKYVGRQKYVMPHLSLQFYITTDSKNDSRNSLCTLSERPALLQKRHQFEKVFYFELKQIIDYSMNKTG